MAKKSATEELADRLHVSGIRRKVAESVASGVNSVRPGRKPPKSLTAELEDRAKGGPAKRSSAAKKAAATRKRKASARSAAAKKAARTRAKKG
jgi:hypothetical protein